MSRKGRLCRPGRPSGSNGRPSRDNGTVGELTGRRPAGGAGRSRRRIRRLKSRMRRRAHVRSPTGSAQPGSAPRSSSAPRAEPNVAAWRLVRFGCGSVWTVQRQRGSMAGPGKTTPRETSHRGPAIGSPSVIAVASRRSDQRGGGQRRGAVDQVGGKVVVVGDRSEQVSRDVGGGQRLRAR